MGKTTIPTYYAKVRDNTKHISSHMIWNCKVHGRPTVKNAERYRVNLNKSYQIGECNEHISKAVGFLVHTHEVAIYRNVSHELVAVAKAPMFEIV